MEFSKTLFGGLKITKNGFSMQYFGYTKKEAIIKFRIDYKKSKTVTQ
jgi:hypothetical protein